MAQPEIILVLDSGALLSAEKDQRVEATIRKWLREGARILIPAPCIAEVLRGHAKDAAANRLIDAIHNVADTDDAIARHAGRRVGATRGGQTVDAIVAATADAHRATDILTTDARDLRALASRQVNIIAL